eukprot:7278900-Alexandrium_andersonii.AAC.1
MSASLVGSEMCIRDRPLPAEQELQRLAAEAAEGVDPAAGIETDDADTVSYTHLTLPTICSV